VGNILVADDDKTCRDSIQKVLEREGHTVKAADGVDVQADLQGSVEYKTHLIKVFCRRAFEAALGRAKK